MRGWRKPGTALCLLVDRSGSMGGRPLATVRAGGRGRRHTVRPATTACSPSARTWSWRRPSDHAKPSDQVVTDVLALRGFGTTDLAGALRVAGAQLQRSAAGRRVAVLLSDCRATVPGDVVAVARGLDELCIVAPAADADEARALAASIGARLATVDGPSGIPDALAAVLDE